MNIEALDFGGFGFALISEVRRDVHGKFASWICGNPHEQQSPIADAQVMALKCSQTTTVPPMSLLADRDESLHSTPAKKKRIVRAKFKHAIPCDQK